jgi:peptidyl-prolyl cis-trans isomerase SDCCAG10
MIQGLILILKLSHIIYVAGDPTGTGQGGSSIWGKPFKDEVHGRIKFNHRGQVAMANENRPNTNQSQFFITLSPCEWLNRKHTIFGKITGNTIFNVLKLGELEVGPNDRPIDTIRITSVEVLWNPFDDIVPRFVKFILRKFIFFSGQASSKLLSLQRIKSESPKKKGRVPKI